MHTPNAVASQIMLIRHGEKPPHAPPPHGVSAHGERDTESITVRGWQRAGALAASGEEEELARHAQQRTGAVLICWRHHSLHVLAQHVLGDHATFPKSWSEDRFDVVWVLDLDPATRQYGFRQVAQELLDGDLPHGTTAQAGEGVSSLRLPEAT